MGIEPNADHPKLLRYLFRSCRDFDRRERLDYFRVHRYPLGFRNALTYQPGCEGDRSKHIEGETDRVGDSREVLVQGKECSTML